MAVRHTFTDKQKRSNVKKILEKIHGFTKPIEHAAVFFEAVVEGVKAYSKKMTEYHEANAAKIEPLTYAPKTNEGE